MYDVYDATKTRRLFRCSEHELLNHRHRLPLLETFWVRALDQKVRPVCTFPTYPNLTIQRYVTDTGGTWVSTRPAVYAVFKNPKHRVAFRHLFPGLPIITPLNDDDDLRPLVTLQGASTLRLFFYEEEDMIRDVLMSPRGRRLADHYSTWMKVCFVLVNTYKATQPDLGLQLWLDFSRQCPSKFRLNACRALWHRTSPHSRGLRLGSLLHLMKKKIVTSTRYTVDPLPPLAIQ